MVYGFGKAGAYDTRRTTRATVYHAAFSPDGTRAITASTDNTARITDIATGNTLATIDHQDWVRHAAFSPDGNARHHRLLMITPPASTHIATGNTLATIDHQELVRHAAFSPDGTRAITASYDNTARITDIATGNTLATIDHQDWVRHAAFSPDGTRAITASNDNTARITDIATGNTLATIDHQGPVYHAAFSPDGTRAITASTDNTARITDIATGNTLATIDHQDTVSHAAFSPDGTRAITASNDNTAHITDIATGNTLATIDHQELVYHAAFSPDGTRAITASFDNTARITDIATGNTLATIDHQGWVIHAAFSPDGTRAITASYDNTARITDIATGNTLATIDHQDTVSHAAFSPDGTRAITASADNTARITDIATGNTLATIDHQGWVIHAAFSPDGTRAITASYDNTARITDIATGNTLATIDHQGDVSHAAFSPDGTRAITASRDNTAHITDIATGNTLATIDHQELVRHAAFSPDGTRAITASNDNTAHITDIATGNTLATIDHQELVYHAAFSPDGTRAITASFDNTARITDIATGNTLATIDHQGWVIHAAFSPDGTRAITASDDNTARITDIATGNTLATIDHQNIVIHAAFSPDGNRAITASYDNTARITDIATGNTLATIDHQGTVSHAAFSPDGTRAITASTDNTARISDGNTGQLLLLINHGAWDWNSTYLSEAGFFSNKNSIQTFPERHLRHLDTPVRTSSLGWVKGTASTALTDGRLMFWNGATLDSLAAFRNPGMPPITELAFSPQGTMLLAKDSLGTISIYHTPGNKWATIIHWMVANGRWLLPSLLIVFSGLAFQLILKLRALQSVLIRLPGKQTPRLSHFKLQPLTQSLHRGTSLISLSQQLRRRSVLPSTRLHPAQTISRTIEEHGFFSPAYANRLVSPEYLILVDRITFSDHQARFVEALVHQLRHENVPLVIYYFDGDPRLCLPEHPSQPAQSLDTLARTYANYRLLVFSDAGVFFSPLTGEIESWTERFERWQDRFLMTPESPDRWNYQEYILDGYFSVVPASNEGLEEIANRLQNGHKEWKDKSPGTYPRMLQQRPLRWLEKGIPETLEVEHMLEAVRTYLGADGYYWLSACAIYPDILWQLTLNLGKVLKNETNKSLLEDKKVLIRLARLPWMRYGYMPDWLRKRLITDLNESQRRNISFAFDSFQMEWKGIKEAEADFQIADAEKDTLREIAKRAIKRALPNAPAGSEWEDYIFRSFRLNEDLEPLAMRLPQALEQAFRAKSKDAVENRMIQRARLLLLRWFWRLVLFLFIGWLLYLGWNEISPMPMPVEELGVYEPGVGFIANMLLDNSTGISTNLIYPVLFFLVFFILVVRRRNRDSGGRKHSMPGVINGRIKRFILTTLPNSTRNLIQQIQHFLKRPQESPLENPLENPQGNPTENPQENPQENPGPQERAFEKNKEAIDGFKTSPSVFISYSQNDQRQAITIYQGLSDRGINCFMPDFDVKKMGSSYFKEIEEALMKCDQVIVLVSSNASQSKYVLNEVTIAISENKDILPVLLDGKPLSDQLKLTLAHYLQHIDASRLTDEEIIEFLTTTVKRNNKSKMR